MTAKEFYDSLPIEWEPIKINIIEDYLLGDMMDLNIKRKGVLSALNDFEIDSIPKEELPNPMLMMKMCDEMIHSMNCPKRVRQKFFAKKKGFCRLLMKHGCATDFVAFGEKYISFKVGNEKVMTKRKKLFAHYQPKHIADGGQYKKTSVDNLPTPYSYVPFMMFFLAVDFAREMDMEEFWELCHLL